MEVLKDDYLKKYNRWLQSPVVDQRTKDELRSIASDDNEILRRFEKPLSFGTSGLRGVMRAGTNGMNVYTVRHASQALSDMILMEADNKGIVIAHDSRHNSRLFAKEAASVFAANGIKVYLFDDLRPTPELSFAIRYLGATAGINITASHNTSEYNGYKAYWSDGGQMVPKHTNIVTENMKALDIFDDIKVMRFDDAEVVGLIESIGEEVDNAYLDSVKKQSLLRDDELDFAKETVCVYTPFHGCGYKYVPRLLSEEGFEHVITVDEQMELDGDFPTVKSPNPENIEGFSLALEYAKKCDADIIIGTDPDADRCAAVVRVSKGEYYPLTGNQMGAMLLEYVASRKLEDKARFDCDNKKPLGIRSIVSSPMFDTICKHYGIHVDYSLTGFKYIAELIKKYNETGLYKYIFGYEESIGFLSGDYTRDKDGISTALIFAEMACSYKARDMSVYDGLNELYQNYGYFAEKSQSFMFDGDSAIEEMSKTMDQIRKNLPTSLGYNIVEANDYKDGFKDFVPSDILEFHLENDSVAILRPSGTEPKIKLYIHSRAKTEAEAIEKTAIISKEALKLIEDNRI